MDKLPPGQMTTQQTKDLKDLLEEYQDIFAIDLSEIGSTDLTTHRIETPERVMPQAKQPYPENPKNEAFITEEIERMLKHDIIRPSHSPWAAPVIVVGKKTGDKRFCVDYRALNKVTEKDKYPFPRIESLLDKFGPAKWFSALDLASGYWQIHMDEWDKPKTAFTCSKGLFECN